MMPGTVMLARYARDRFLVYGPGGWFPRDWLTITFLLGINGAVFAMTVRRVEDVVLIVMPAGLVWFLTVHFMVMPWQRAYTRAVRRIYEVEIEAVTEITRLKSERNVDAGGGKDA